MEHIVKANKNRSEINVEIKTFKSCNGGVLIETNGKEEIETLDQEIRAKLGNIRGPRTLKKENTSNNIKRTKRHINKQN